jgi:hypothetical protein
MVRHRLFVTNHIAQVAREIIERRISFHVLHLKGAIFDNERAYKGCINR